MKVRYTGPAIKRSIKQADWTRAGVEGQGAVTWTKDAPVQEVDDKAAQFLLSKHKQEFKEEQENTGNDEAAGNTAAAGKRRS